MPLSIGLNAGEPYAVAFGGQGGAWLENLEELVSSAGHRVRARVTLVGEAALLLEPVARELVVVRPIGFQPMQWVRALAAEEPLPSRQAADRRPPISVPGVLLTQMAADARAEPPGHGSVRQRRRSRWPATRRASLAVEALAAKGAQGCRAAGAGCS